MIQARRIFSDETSGLTLARILEGSSTSRGAFPKPQVFKEVTFGVAAQVHMGAALPQNYIAFEYAKGEPEWWYDIVDGLPDPIVKNGFIDVWDKPGLGITFRVQQAKAHVAEEDRDFFD
jgi:hypothetical protein